MTQTIDLKPLRIGHLELSGPAMLAALAGYSDLPFRRLCRRYGASYASTEVTLDKSINLSPKLRRKLVQLADDDHPVAGQVMGCQPETLVTAGRHLQEMGVDVVDLNFACPVGKVLRRRRGGHCMRDPDLAVRMIRAVAAALDVPVTAKLRIGFDADDTDRSNFWRIAEAAFDAGLAAICVHGRTVEQRYTGRADWAFIAAVKRHFADRTIIGSGDLHSPADGLRMLQETGVDGITFARGALGNPWIFREFHQLARGEPATPPTLAEQRAVLEEHYRACVELYGPESGRRVLFRHGIKYASRHPTPKRVRQAFIESDRHGGLTGVLETFYDGSAG